jgi:hypothetical protein
MVPTLTTFPGNTLTVYACDNGKIVIINKDAASHNLDIGMVGKSSGTFTINETISTGTAGPIARIVSGVGYSGGLITWTIPGSTCASIDVS